MTSPNVTVVTTPELGDRTYVVDDGHCAVVIDPQRDINRVIDVVTARGVEVSHVLETHIHNDYVSGGLALATATGAAYGVAAAEQVAFPRLPVDDGDRLVSGALRWHVIATPGHTPHHLSFAATAGDEPTAVFTGGSLLYGTVGRTDLISAEATEGLTRAQYRSVGKLLATLPPSTAVYPTHGFGSFCASAPGELRDDGTIAGERSGNVVSRFDDEDAFVEELVAGLTPYPRYYAHMGPRNRTGPPAADLSPPAALDHEELRRRIAEGEWVVDLRSRRAFAAGHLAGTIGMEHANSFAAYLGWAVPWGTAVTLVGDDPDELGDAQRQMALIGIDRPAGRMIDGGQFEAADWVRTFRVVGFEELAAEGRRPGVAILDVRDAHEWAEGHVAGALRVPFYELDERLADVPDAEVWVYCRSGHRASIACSLLERAGRTVVLVDDDFANAERKGVAVVTEG